MRFDLNASNLARAGVLIGVFVMAVMTEKWRHDREQDVEMRLRALERPPADAVARGTAD